MDNRAWRRSAARFKQLDDIARRTRGGDKDPACDRCIPWRDPAGDHGGDRTPAPAPLSLLLSSTGWSSSRRTGARNSPTRTSPATSPSSPATSRATGDARRARGGGAGAGGWRPHAALARPVGAGQGHVLPGEGGHARFSRMVIPAIALSSKSSSSGASATWRNTWASPRRRRAGRLRRDPLRRRPLMDYRPDRGPPGLPWSIPRPGLARAW